MTNNDEFAELARIIRSQGVMRNVRSTEYREGMEKKYPDIDSRFLFTNIGFNFRPTEMEGAFGLVQFAKFKQYLDARIDNAHFFTSQLQKFSQYITLPQPHHNAKVSWFFYPIMVRDDAPFTTKQIVTFLEEWGIETRPIMSGDYTRHPLFHLYDHRIHGELSRAAFIHKHGFIVGVHGGITHEDREYMAKTFEDFFATLY